MEGVNQNQSAMYNRGIIKEKRKKLQRRLAAIGIRKHPVGGEARNTLVKEMAKRCGLWASSKQTYNYRWYTNSKYPDDPEKPFNQILATKFVGPDFVWPGEPPPAAAVERSPQLELPEPETAVQQEVDDEEDHEEYDFPSPQFELLPVVVSPQSAGGARLKRKPKCPSANLNSFCLEGDRSRPRCPWLSCGFHHRSEPRVYCELCRQWWHLECVGVPLPELFVCPYGCENASTAVPAAYH